MNQGHYSDDATPPPNQEYVHDPSPAPPPPSQEYRQRFAPCPPSQQPLRHPALCPQSPELDDLLQDLERIDANLKAKKKHEETSTSIEQTIPDTDEAMVVDAAGPPSTPNPLIGSQNDPPPPRPLRVRRDQGDIEGSGEERAPTPTSVFRQISQHAIESRDRASLAKYILQ